MARESFCLKWNNYLSNMNEMFLIMLNDETNVDVTLACEGDSLKAHKMVLAACSPFFADLFATNPCKHPIVILKDVLFDDLKTIIDFMYNGEINVSHEQLSTLLKTADMLKIKGLTEVTKKHTRTKSVSGPGKRRRKRKSNKSSGSEGSESDEENTAPKKRSGPRTSKTSARSRLADRNTELGGIEPAGILEQSMATAEVTGAECEHSAEDNVVFDGDVHGDDRETSENSQGKGRGRPPKEPKRRSKNISDLESILDKPISQFEVILDNSNMSPIWSYFGELAHADPNTNEQSIVDEENNFCLKCILDAQAEDDNQAFKDAKVAHLRKGTGSSNYKYHLKIKHGIDLGPMVNRKGTNTRKSGKGTSKARKSGSMSIIPLSPDEEAADAVEEIPTYADL